MTLLAVAIFCCIFQFPQVSGTEVSMSSSTKDESLGIKVYLPLLACHAKYTGYKQVLWFKDDELLKNGSNALSDHFLSLPALLSNDSAVHFEHPLKLQGYYWCKTDFVVPSTTHKYLFRIPEVQTYVGRLLATQDSLGSDDTLSLEEKIARKKEVYEIEMEQLLFGFLPTPNTFVYKMRMKKDGLLVQFYLYDIPTLIRRKKMDVELKLDRDGLEYIHDYLHNETMETDRELSGQIAFWLDSRGISEDSIDIRSTLGCYEEKSLAVIDGPQEITWPPARIGEVVIPTESCSSKSGLAVTRICTGSFTGGARWGNPSENCDVPAEGLTLKLKELYNHFGVEKHTSYIHTLRGFTVHPSRLSVTDVHIVTNILKDLSEEKLDKEDISGLFSVIDHLVEINRTELVAARSTIYVTNRIIQIIDNTFQAASKNKQIIRLAKHHILVDMMPTKTAKNNSHIIGVSVSSENSGKSLKGGSVEFLMNGHKIPRKDSIAYFLLPPDLVMSRELNSKDPCNVKVVFFKEWTLFPEPKSILLKRHYIVLPTPVMYASISGGPAWNLSEPVQLYFRDTLRQKIENPVCVYYDPGKEDEDGVWSTEGCEYGGLRHGFYNCRCRHLSIFAIILSQRPDAAPHFQLGTSVYVGCGVSIIALCLTVLLYILSKLWRKTIDHSILFCLALSMLCCVILIFVSEMHFLWHPACLVLALLFHYTIFSIFGWLLVLAVVYQMRFTKKTDFAEVPHFMIKASLSVWGAPIFIVLIIWISKEFEDHNKDTCWTIVSQVSRVSVIPVVTIILVSLCVIACATYALTCRFKKDFLIENTANYTELVVKFRVTFTIYIMFVLTWLFGFFALHKGIDELRILFSIAITLTAYYVTLFFIFQEISFWDLCPKRKKKEEEIPTGTVQYNAKSYKATVDPNADK